jgi:hypothetical protein
MIVWWKALVLFFAILFVEVADWFTYALLYFREPKTKRVLIEYFCIVFIETMLFILGMAVMYIIK